ncbi:hypothetical protein [Paenibacillus sp. NFR01]|uniref:hypothetical protein n=1 Tax=Paenibacillus sp. NFR01 TaxID=1566279 RepID=UPI0008D82794|nr:hypothetical protein [Paenibacillus sp. NFR01]SET18407.1 hypothetical protein SAMN03159358_0953 [Paenibacillus sp. NFR01]
MRRTHRIVSTGVDVYVFNDENMEEVDLAAECGGAPDYNLSFIPDGTMVTLKRGSITRTVKLNQSVASECIYNMFGLSRPLARLFNLKDRARYTLYYNTATKTFTFRRKPITFYAVKITANSKQPAGRVDIGNGLGYSGALGITLKSGSSIRLKNGAAAEKLTLRKINSEEFENTEIFRLNPSAIRKLGLVAGTTYRVSYNQLTQTLAFHGKAPAATRRRPAAPGRTGHGFKFRRTK